MKTLNILSLFASLLSLLAGNVLPDSTQSLPRTYGTNADGSHYENPSNPRLPQVDQSGWRTTASSPATIPQSVPHSLGTIPRSSVSQPTTFPNTEHERLADGFRFIDKPAVKTTSDGMGENNQNRSLGRLDLRTVVQIHSSNGRTASLGSGTIVGRSGNNPYRYLVLTNEHVVRNSNKHTVGVPNTGLFQASLLDSGNGYDLATLVFESSTKIEPAMVLQTGPSSSQTVTTFGYPNGTTSLRRHTGVVSKWFAFQQGGEAVCVSFTGSVYPGWSGGGVFDDNGDLVGVVWGSLDGVYAHHAVAVTQWFCQNGRCTPSRPLFQRPFNKPAQPQSGGGTRNVYEAEPPQPNTPSTTPSSDQTTSTGCDCKNGGCGCDLTELNSRIHYLESRILTLESTASVPGPQGIPGPTGPAGPAGPKGAPGPQGESYDPKELQELKNKLDNLENSFKNMSGTLRVRAQPK